MLVVVLMVALAALGFWWYYAGQPREAPAPPAITAEAKTYVRNLRLSGVEMKATKNFAGAMVVEIVGQHHQHRRPHAEPRRTELRLL